jgi:hypothetical protein
VRALQRGVHVLLELALVQVDGGGVGLRPAGLLPVPGGRPARGVVGVVRRVPVPLRGAGLDPLADVVPVLDVGRLCRVVRIEVLRRVGVVPEEVAVHHPVQELGVHLVPRLHEVRLPRVVRVELTGRLRVLQGELPVDLVDEELS